MLKHNLFAAKDIEKRYIFKFLDENLSIKFANIQYLYIFGDANELLRFIR